MTDRIGLPDNACNRHKQCESVLCLVLDRVYRCGDGGAPVFIEVDAPTDDELHALLQTLIKRLMLLTRRGVLVADMGQWPPSRQDDDTSLLLEATPTAGSPPRQAYRQNGGAARSTRVAGQAVR